MRLIVQRSLRASVRSNGEQLGAIAGGSVVLVGVAADDTPELVDRMADKLLALRYFEDAQGRTNLSIDQVGGAFLVVSQFTLYADLRRGRRPGFTNAAAARALRRRSWIGSCSGCGQQVARWRPVVLGQRWRSSW